MEQEKISSTLEDYLEAIAELIEVKGHAHTKDIADRMCVRMPSVTSVLQTLAAKDLIHYQSHQPVTLTALGTERAAVIRLRHAALKKFFHEVLKLDPAEADETACKIEHVVSEKIMSRFVSLTDSILNRDGSADLRNHLNATLPQIGESHNDEGIISLNQLEIGQSGIVTHVSSNLRGVKKFADLGLVPGTLLQMEGHAPLGDLLRICVMGSRLSLRAKDAEHIQLKLTN